MEKIGPKRPLSLEEQAEVDIWTAYEEIQHGYLTEDYEMVEAALAKIEDANRRVQEATIPSME